jgi:hypothetical protein
VDPVETLDADWLRDFYKECGRELTLAYTTLNQVKNWTLFVQGSIIASVASFSRPLTASPGEPMGPQVAFPVVIGSLLAYVLTLRFFVRAIHCAINLSRWNVLQSDIVQFKLAARVRGDGTVLSMQAIERRLRSDIQNYYHRWLSPVSRPSQIASNFRLGFGPLMALQALLIVWGATVTWDHTIIRALVAFAVGATLIQSYDFWISCDFDTPDDADARRIKKHPPTSLAYTVQWVALLAISVVIALWPWIASLL